MLRRRLALALSALFLGALSLSMPSRAIAVTDRTFTTDLTVGAGRTLPRGTWGFTDGCRVGVDATTEYRCSFEFDISAIPSSAQIESATIDIRKTAGCGLSNCAVNVNGYTGNGSADLGDVALGSLVRIFTPAGSTVHADVAQFVQTRAAAGDDWLGFALVRDPSSTKSPDWQDFDIAGSDRVSLTVSWINRPVDVKVHHGGSGQGVVTSSPDGISCGEICSATYEWLEPVTLTADPHNGATFNHWDGGECDGSTNPVCSFDVPALPVDTTAVFDALGPPVSAPPNPTPTARLPPPPTSAPTSHGSTGPAPTVVPAPTDVIASDGTVITPAPTIAPAPTIVGLGDQGVPVASAGVPLPILIVLILILGGVVGGGVYWFTKRRQAGAP